MALAKRIIPCLDVNAGRVVKGVNFVGLRDAGDPVELAERYNSQGADELVFLDITASSDAREIMADISYFGTMMVHKGIADGMTAYLRGIPEELYALFGTGYLGYTAARIWGKVKGVER